MKVNKELLEKYHLGLCSEAEKDAVQQWLESELTDEEVVFSANEDRQLLQAQMWSEIASVLPPEESKVAVTAKTTKHHFLFPRAIAASVILLLAASTFVWWYHDTRWTKPVSISNGNNSGTQQVSMPGMLIAIGPKSQANIVTSNFHRSASIDFCGTLLIDPDEDVELTFKTHCTASSVQEKRMFRKGQTYIAVHYEFNSHSELLVVNSNDMMQLPSLLRKQLITQFKI